MMSDEIAKAREFVDQIDADGHAAVRLCSDVCLYLDGPPDRYREGLLDFYRIALDEIGPSIRQVRVGQDGRWKPRPKDLSPLLAHWFDRGGPSKGSFSLRLEAGEQPEEASDQAFEFCWILGQGHVRLVLPVERALVDGDRFKDLVVRLASRVRFKSGSAGISANIVRDYPAHRENGAISVISQRYLGIDLGRPQYWNDFMSHGLKTVNWITLLGPDMLERAMAGRTQAVFYATLGPRTTRQPIGDGLLLQAGPAPRFGLHDHPAELDDYRALARALHDLQIPWDVLRSFNDIGGTENTRRWLKRFLA